MAEPEPIGDSVEVVLKNIIEPELLRKYQELDREHQKTLDAIRADCKSALRLLKKRGATDEAIEAREQECRERIAEEETAHREKVHALIQERIQKKPA